MRKLGLDDEGIVELMAAVSNHFQQLKAGHRWYAREIARSRQEIGQLLREEFISRLADSVSPVTRETLIESVAQRQIDPYSAVDRLFAEING